ncbi:PilZ domain-containing protein [Myxococcus stipitatus]|uniref:PilZ domain-containing protein n=1 Tax=Myxococcus stipitatus TaxID=83455 RepID=UPI001F1E6858|nr:PilZ domain-containing protein [Myxococcus stipitatus]MCE9666794.1 PilZ domain-containing protein [Myxococcus stipitatus]
MSVPTQDVLIVHPNEGRRAALAEVLGVHRVVAVESQVEATRRMEVSAPTLIIAPPDNARRFLRHVDRAAPEAVRVFVCAQSDRQGLEELVETAAEGHVFSTLDDSLTVSELGRRLTSLLQHRSSARVAPSTSLTVRFRLDGVTYTGSCLDVGNFGAALRVPLGASLNAFIQGTALESLTMERDGRTVLHVPRAFVRHAQQVHASTQPYLRLGITWGEAMDELTQPPSIRMRDPVIVLAALRKAVRRDAAIWLHFLDTPSSHFRLDAPVVELMDGRAVLRGLNDGTFPAEVGDVLQLSFEVGGQSYTGATSVLSRGEHDVMLSVPRTFSLKNRRGLQRFRLGPEHRFLVIFNAPINGERITRSVLDLSGRGFAFPFDASCEVLPAGSQLEASLLLPDGSEVPVRAEVRSVDAVTTDSRFDRRLRPYRCGVRLLDVPSAVRDAIQDAFMASRCAAADDGGSRPFPTIWRMMEESHYGFHPDYAFGREPEYMRDLEHTHDRLARAKDLGRSIVYSDEGEMMGHVSGLRMHSRSWLVQHLAVRPGYHRHEQIANELTALTVEMGEAIEDVEFLRYMWRADNRWPNRLGTWLARVMESRGFSLLRTFHYLRLPLEGTRPMPEEGLPAVREARPEDREWLESHLRSRGQVVRVLAEDLQADDEARRTLKARFEAAGLYRDRRLFVVDGEHGPLAMALVEEASPGLSLIEVTNAFWLECADRAHPQAGAALRALVRHGIEHARARGRPSAVALAEPPDVALVAEAGFKDQGRFCEWIFHRSMVRRWTDLWRSLFERLSRPRRARVEESACT